MATTTRSKSILLLGAGELGTAILEGLTSHPRYEADQWSVSVLLRPSTINTTDASKARANAYLTSLGATLVPGDVVNDSVTDLADTFRRFGVVIGCTGMGLPAGTQVRLTRAVLEAAAAAAASSSSSSSSFPRTGDGSDVNNNAGTIRYFPWQWGIDYDTIGPGSAQDLFDEQLEVRRILRGPENHNNNNNSSSGVEGKGRSPLVDWTIVSTGLFMSFLFQPEFGPVDLRKRTVRALGSWETRVTLTTPRDIGRVAAALVLDRRGDEEEDTGEEGVVFAGGDTVTYGRVAELVRERFGDDDQDQKWETEVWDLESLGRRRQERPGDSWVKYQMVFAKGEGTAWDLERTVNRKRGMEMTGLEAYLKGMEIDGGD
ncbi:NAD(P)-binding protein [Xylariomycetidae sp. FL2044]|nr:NAD(P)-binding protein [Xylariomycetidae sp. FL2044]